MSTMTTLLAAILLLLTSLLLLPLPPPLAEAKDGSGSIALYKIVLRNTTPNTTVEANCRGVYDPASPGHIWRHSHFSLPFGANWRMAFAHALWRSNRLLVTCTFKDLSSGCWAEDVQVFDSREGKCFFNNGGCSYEFRNTGNKHFLFGVEDGRVVGFFPFAMARCFDEPYPQARPLLGRTSGCDHSRICSSFSKQ